MLFAGAAATFYALFFGGESLQKARQLQNEIDDQTRTNEEVRLDNKKIANDIRAAKKNPANAEQRLREHYFIKEGEVLIIPPENKKQ